MSIRNIAVVFLLWMYHTLKSVTVTSRIDEVYENNFSS